jgi:hypothetical protein
MEFKLQSDEIDKLTAAFVEARKQSRPVREDAKANYGTYVSLSEIKACTNEALLSNGLSLTQGRTFSEGHVLLVTKLSHVSGQWQASYVPLFVPENPKNLDQAYGTAMSYQRRYELYGLFGILGEDNDPDSVGEEVRPVSSEFISDKQAGFIRMLLKNHSPEVEKALLDAYKSLDKIPRSRMDSIVEKLKGK